MITEYDLQEAIAECEGQINPNANTCLKLASFYIIKDHMYPEDQETPAYSFSAPPSDVVEQSITYSSDTEFAREINGKDPNTMWSVMDELMSTLQMLNPRLYNGVMDIIQDLK